MNANGQDFLESMNRLGWNKKESFEGKDAGQVIALEKLDSTDSNKIEDGSLQKKLIDLLKSDKGSNQELFPRNVLEWKIDRMRSLPVQSNRYLELDKPAEELYELMLYGNCEEIAVSKQT